MEEVADSAGGALRGGSDAARSDAARVMGSATTPAKRVASAENGKRGGRPKGIPQSEETKARIRAARLARNAADRSGAGVDSTGAASVATG